MRYTLYFLVLLAHLICCATDTKSEANLPDYPSPDYQSQRRKSEPSVHLQAGGMKVELWSEDDEIVVIAESPERGWIAVGFNNAASLANARLVMGAVSGSEVVLEEHITKPPNHARRRTSNTVHLIAASERAGRTHLSFRVAIDPKDPARPEDQLHLHGPIHLILAYSTSDDLQHHSRFRKSFEVEIPWRPDKSAKSNGTP